MADPTSPRANGRKRQPYRVFSRPLVGLLRYWTYEVEPKHGTRPIPGGPYHNPISAWLAARSEAKREARVPDVLGNPFGVGEHRHEGAADE